MQEKEYDLFMNMLRNDNASLETFVAGGLNVDNTQLLDKSEYRASDKVQEALKDQYGQFDQVKFDQLYNGAQMYYNALSADNYDASMYKQITYHRDDIFAPEDKRRVGPDFTEISSPNPYKIQSNTFQLGKVGNRTRSIDEIAQTHKVLLNPTQAGEDLSNAQWGDSPNDGFLKYFTDTLVLAQYDTDGTHPDPITGKTVEHKKGDLKLDQNGEFYYERLDGRDVYDKRVLNKMNTITTDGSTLNRYDFFDSDDIDQKSIGGMVLKNLALVGTMFIPYAGPWIAGLSVATQLAGMGATLGKMLIDSDSKTLSEIEGWAKSVSRQGAQTEYAQNTPWCWENFINLIGDVAGQLKEQRFIFEKIPQALSGTNIYSESSMASKMASLESKYQKFYETKIKNLGTLKDSNKDLVEALQSLRVKSSLQAQMELDSFMKGYQKIGEVLSKGYMTAITVMDTYGEAKNAGASDIDATLLTLGYAAGEYALLNTGIGEWVLPELRVGRYKRKAIIDTLTKEGKDLQSKWRELSSQAGNTAKESKKNYVKTLFNIGKKIANAEYVNGSRGLVPSLAAGVGEGVEEVSEEILADFSKGCYDIVKWLQGDNTRLNTFGYDFTTNQFNAQELVDRYGMSLIGGFVGGGLTNLGTNYHVMKDLGNMDRRKAIQEIIYMSRNGEIDKFLREVNKMQLGDKTLSTQFQKNEDGTIVFLPGTENDNQDTYIKQAITQQVKIIQDILNANGATLSDDSFLDIQTLNDLRLSALHQSVMADELLNEFNNLSTDIIQLTSQIRTVQNSSIDTNKDGNVSDKEERKGSLTDVSKETIQDLERQLKDKQQQLQDLLSGKRSYEFIADALFEMTTALSGNLATVTFPLYAEQLYKKDFSKLTDAEKARASEKYEKWKKSEGRSHIKGVSTLFRNVSYLASNTIKESEQEYLKVPIEIQQLNSVITDFYNRVKADTEENWVKNAQTIINSTPAKIMKWFIDSFGEELDRQKLQEILDRNNNIDKSLSEEAKKAFREKNQRDYVSTTLDIMSRNIDKLVQPFIEQGFANVETKEQLGTLLDYIKDYTRGMIAQWDVDHEGDEFTIDEDNPYVDTLSHINKLKKEIQNLNRTPVEKGLNKFSISVGNEPIKISELHERLNAALSDTSQDVSRFIINDELYQDLENAITTIKMYKAAILAARTDSVGVNDLYGYNATLNEVAHKMQGQSYPELAEIDSKVADIFINDLEINLNKLEFLKKLYNINRGQKLFKQDKIAIKKDLLIYKKLKFIVQVPDEFSKWEGFQQLKAAIESADLLSDCLDNNITILSDEQREKFEKQSIQIQDAIYDFFQIESNKAKLKDPQKLSELINPSKFQLYTKAEELLDEELDSIDDNSMVWWIASRAAVKSSDFYNLLKSTIDINSDNPLVPIASQELAIYNNYASIVNGNVFTAFSEALKVSMLNDWKVKDTNSRKEIIQKLGISEKFLDKSFDDYAINFLPIPRFQNIILTEGTPGSGKSTAVYYTVINLLKQSHKEDLLKRVYVVHGANPEGAVSFRNNAGLEQANTRTFGREGFMKEINSEWKEYNMDEKTHQYIVPESDYEFTSENKIQSSLGINNTQEPPSLIILDEVSQFTVYDLDQIDKYARKYGITVLVAGDFDQSGVIGKHPVKVNNYGFTWNLQLERTNFIRSPKLGISMRTDNSLKTLNLQKMQAYMQNPTGDVPEFEYYEDETGLYGDRVFKYQLTIGRNDKKEITSNYSSKNLVINKVIQQVDKLIETLKKGEKIGYIYSDSSSELYTKLMSTGYADYIETKKGNSAQGSEGRYYIIEADFTENTEKFLKDVYTGMSRAQQGSIIIAPYGKDEKIINFSDKKVSQKIDESLSKQTKQVASKRRKELLDKIIQGGNSIEYIPRVKEGNSTVRGNSGQKKGGLSDGIPPSPSPQQQTLHEEKSKLIRKMSLVQNLEELDRVVNEAYQQNSELQHDEQIKKLYQTLADKLAPLPEPVNIQLPSLESTTLLLPPPSNFLLPPGQSESQGGPQQPPQEVGPEPKYPLQTEFVELTHNDLVIDYGNKMNLNKFSVNIDGVSVPLTLSDIPFITRDQNTRLLCTGTSTIVNFNGKNLVVVNINGIHIPFYISTERDGKWYPIFGIGTDGWLNEGTEEQINTYYDSILLQSIAKRLNELLGTGLGDTLMGPPISEQYEVSNGQKILNPAIQYINQDFTQTSNNLPTTLDTVSNNINQTITKIQQVIDNIIGTRTLPEPKQQIEPLIYEDDLSPITNTDIIDSEQYHEIIDDSNQGESPSQSYVSESGGIEMLLHSFNTFETGVLVGEDGKPVPVGNQEWMDKRIDSVNGLVKLDKYLGNDIKTVQDYVLQIGRLRSILFNTENKSELCTKLQNELGLSEVYCTFALKSSPRPSEGNIQKGKEFVNSTPSPMAKGISERTKYNGSTDTRSHEVHYKSIVAIIGSKDTKDIVELPLLVLSSPFTIAQIQEGEGAYRYPRAAEIIDTQIKRGESMHDIVDEIIKDLDRDPEYQDLVNLFKLYNFTDEGVFYIRDAQWTPLKNLSLQGSQFSINRGRYQILDGFNYDWDTNPESEWVTVYDYATNPEYHNPQSRVTEQMMVSLSGEVDAGNGKRIKIAKAGHPFVLQAWDIDLSNDVDIVDYFIRQEIDQTLPKKVKLIYIIPPKATLREYFDNIHKILSKEEGVQNIGQLFTSYKILKALLQSDPEDSPELVELKLKFYEDFNDKFPKIAKKVQESIDMLDSLGDMVQQKDVLYSPQDWGNLGFQSDKLVALAGLFDGVLARLAYNRNTLRVSLGEEATSTINEDTVQLMESILIQSGIDGIYYNCKVPKSEEVQTIGPFHIFHQGDKYTIDGKPCKIHGKIDSYQFRGNMSWLVNYALSKLVQSGEHQKSKDSFKYLERDSNLWRQKSKEQLQIENTVKYLMSKTGKDFSDYYQNTTMQDGNVKVVREILEQDNGLLAFTLNGKIKVSNSYPKILKGTVTLYDTNGEIISSLNQLDTIDNNGNYYFKVSTYGDSIQVYSAIYNSSTDSITLTQELNTKQSSLTLSVTEDNFEDYINNGREILEDMFFYEDTISEAFSKPTYNEFIQALDDIEYIGESRIEDLTKLLDKATDEQKKVINDLIELEKSHSLDNQSTEVCPVSFKILF